MKYYVSKSDVSIVDGRIVVTENILTRPDNLRATSEMHRRMERIGIPNIAVCKYTLKRYKMLTAATNKRRKAARSLTMAEVAEIVEEINKDQS
jgi:hypothetical protein|tara:strand:- start:12881 stop:13159 length:279 start_codon:yes stop_codon:yes gene_type:complete